MLKLKSPIFVSLMRTYLLIIFLFVCDLQAQQPFDVNQRLTPAQLVEDVDFYLKTLDEAHINPYTYISAKQFRARAEELKSRIREKGAMTQKEFWLLFAPLVSSIQDSHTVIADPRFFIKAETDTTRYFPVKTVYIDGKIVVQNSFADEKIERGAVITAVNGVSAENLLKKLSEHRFGVERERIENAALWLWVGAAEVFGRPEKFVVSFADGSKKSVNGLTITEIIKRENAAKATNSSAATNAAPLELKLLGRDVAYLNSKTFGYDLEKYKELLKDVFTQIKTAGAKKLIIDVRENSGGNSALGDALIDMFNSKTYRHYSMQWKRSDQYLEELKRRKIPVSDKYEVLRLGQVFSSESPIVNPGENPLRFNGQVYVLSSKDTFSSGQMFLAVVKDNSLAKVIGEETNEPACSFGETLFFSLPNSRLRTSLSVKYWVPPGGCKDASGVLPDVLVKRRVTDYVTSKDAILEETLKIINEKSN